MEAQVLQNTSSNGRFGPAVVNRILMVLAFLGLIISVTLSAGELLSHDVPCGVSHGCAQVAQSPYNSVFGIPNAFLGLGAYLLLSLFAIARALTWPGQWGKWVMWGYVIAAVGAMFSVYLQYMSFTAIHATCPWCFSSAVDMVLTLGLYALLFRQTRDSAAPDGWRRSKLDFNLVAGLTPLALLLCGVQYVQVAQGPTLDSANLAMMRLDQYVPKGAHIYGNPGAKITVVEFGDLMCPACRRDFPMVLKIIDASKGRVRLVFHHRPLQSLPGHEMSLPAAFQSEIAGEHNVFFQYLSAVYQLKTDEENPGTPELLQQVAKTVGLDPTEIHNRTAKVDTDPAFQRLNDDVQLSDALGISSTPTFVVLAPGLPPKAYQDMAKLEAALSQPQVVNTIRGEK